jgi:hypothetical protein
MRALVLTEGGGFAVDLETEEVEPESVLAVEGTPEVGLPRLVDAAVVGSTIVAVVDSKPPLLVSHDAGATWRESGRGLPKGRAVAIDESNPDTIVYASRNRLHVSDDGGRFWRTLGAELPEIRSVQVETVM